jgi:hypothetical protein
MVKTTTRKLKQRAFEKALEEIHSKGYGFRNDKPQYTNFASTVSVSDVLITTPMIDMLREKGIEFYISSSGKFVLA